MSPRRTIAPIDPEALLCALIIAPYTFSRNRFFALYEDPSLARIRRRAARVRGIARQLAGDGRPQAEIVGEQVLGDGQVLLRYRVPELGYSRTTALSAVEAAALRYALHRARGAPLPRSDKALVERTLEKLGPDLRRSVAEG
jgi:hypothetical protein